MLPKETEEDLEEEEEEDEDEDFEDPNEGEDEKELKKKVSPGEIVESFGVDKLLSDAWNAEILPFSKRSIGLSSPTEITNCHRHANLYKEMKMFRTAF